MYGNYRICFGGQNVSYFRNFHACRNMFSTIDKVIAAAHARGILHIWWFFEPYTEITWFADNGDFVHEAMTIIEQDAYKVSSILTPANGSFSNWYGTSEEESLIGTGYYTAMANASRILLMHRHTLDEGIGLKNHYQRCLHTLANQCAMSYWQEGTACIKHGLLCFVSWFCKSKTVIRIHKTFRMSSGLSFIP